MMKSLNCLSNVDSRARSVPLAVFCILGMKIVSCVLCLSCLVIIVDAEGVVVVVRGRRSCALQFSF